MKKLMIGVLGISLAVACNSGSQESNAENAETQSTSRIVSEDVSTDRAAEMLKTEDAILLDVRSADEFSSGFIQGALNIDVNSVGFEEKISKLDKSATYIVYCQSGRRSAKSQEIMIDAGFTNVYNIMGGITDWKGRGYDVVTE